MIKEENMSMIQHTGLKSLIIIAGYYGIAMDEKQVIHEMVLQGRAITDNQILIVAKKVKLKCKKQRVNRDSLKKLTLPAILKTNDDKYIVLATIKEDKYLILNPLEGTPKVITSEELEQVWNKEIFMFVPRDYKYRDVKFGLKWFLPTIIKFKKCFIEVLVAAFIMQILALVFPMITQNVIDKVLVHHSLSTLDVLSIGLVIIILFEMVLSIARNYIFTHTTSKVDIILSCRLFDHLFKLPLRYFEARRVGDTVARVRELENIRRFLTGVPMTTLLDALFIVVYIAVMFVYSSKLTYVTLASLPLLIFISAAVTPVLKSRIEEKFNCGAESQSYLVEAITGVQTIKSFGIEPTMQKKWEELLANYTRAGFKTSILSGNAGAVAQSIQKVFDVAILWLGAKLVIEGKLSVGQLVAFRMLAGRVSGPVLRLVQMWQEFQQVAISISRIGDIFNAKKEPTIDGSKTRLPALQGDVKFEKVSFRYRPDGSQVIKDMSFHIRPDTVVGVVGRSGSGKSTISKLIQRFYIPESGKIVVDGIDLALADPTWLRRQIGVVLQENFMFNRSVRDNIAINNPAATMEEIIRVAKIAGAHDFILELTEGYDTMIGERGTGLSGGQRQRIAIARALLSNPKILIFDEATSALDYESERIIQNNLKEICKGRTVFIIAHRLSTIKDADKIMVIERGQVVELGSINELVEKQGLFYYLLKQQEM